VCAVPVHVCGWIAFSSLERGIPSVVKKRGMLVRSEKPWGEGGGANIPARACTYVHTRSSFSAGAPFPPPQARALGGEEGAAPRQELEAVLCVVEISPATRRVPLSLPQFPC
jgi:hypothetical protein